MTTHRSSPTDGNGSPGVLVTRIYLIRHGGVEPEKTGQFIGQLDLPLSREGERRIRSLLPFFEGEKVDRIYSSPLNRALVSAQIFSSHLGVKLIQKDTLKEINLGEFEGKTFEEISSEAPELAEEMMRDPVRFVYPGGESFASLADRAYRIFWEIATRSEGAASLVFTHGGVIRTLVASLLGMVPEGIFKLDVDPAGVTLFEVVGKFPRLKFFNLAPR